jgi:hypothetical protein
MPRNTLVTEQIGTKMYIPENIVKPCLEELKKKYKTILKSLKQMRRKGLKKVETKVRKLYSEKEAKNMEKTTNADNRMARVV